MEKGLFELKKILKCVLLAIVTTVLLGGIFAFFVYFKGIEETAARMVVFAIMIVSVLFSGFVLAKNIEGKGLINGLIMAAIYFAVILLLMFFSEGKIILKSADITRFITLLAAGMLGGVLGINT